jgi:hypothetical protein
VKSELDDERTTKTHACDAALYHKVHKAALAWNVCLDDPRGGLTPARDSEDQLRDQAYSGQPISEQSGTIL